MQEFARVHEVLMDASEFLVDRVKVYLALELVEFRLCARDFPLGRGQERLHGGNGDSSFCRKPSRQFSDFLYVSAQAFNNIPKTLNHPEHTLFDSPGKLLLSLVDPLLESGNFICGPLLNRWELIPEPSATRPCGSEILGNGRSSKNQKR